MRRLTAKMVFSGLVTRLALGRLADEPLAVVREGHDRGRGAHALRILDDLGVLPSMTATHELVVPRSMPMTLPMVLTSSFCGRSAGSFRRPEGKFRFNLRPCCRPPKLAGNAAPCGVLAHIGEPVCAARHTTMDSRGYSTKRSARPRTWPGFAEETRRDDRTSQPGRFTRGPRIS